MSRGDAPPPVLPALIQHPTPWLRERRARIAALEDDLAGYPDGEVWAAGMPAASHPQVRLSGCGVCGAGVVLAAEVRCDVSRPCPECGLEPVSVEICRPCTERLGSAAQGSAPPVSAFPVEAGPVCCAACFRPSSAGVRLLLDGHADHYHEPDGEAGSDCPMAALAAPAGSAWSGMCVVCLAQVGALIALAERRVALAAERDALVDEITG